MPIRIDDEEIEPFSCELPLDQETTRWLLRLAFETGADPAVLVASILHDIRRDDEAAELTYH